MSSCYGTDKKVVTVPKQFRCYTCEPKKLQPRPVLRHPMNPFELLPEENNWVAQLKGQPCEDRIRQSGCTPPQLEYQCANGQNCSYYSMMAGRTHPVEGFHASTKKQNGGGCGCGGGSGSAGGNGSGAASVKPVTTKDGKCYCSPGKVAPWISDSRTLSDPKLVGNPCLTTLSYRQRLDLKRGGVSDCGTC